MMGYYYGNMMGGAGWGAASVFGSLFLVFTLVLMVLGIIALWKYITKG